MSSSPQVIEIIGYVNNPDGFWGSGSGTLITPDGKQWQATFSIGAKGSLSIVASMTPSIWLNNYNNSSGTFTLNVESVTAGNIPTGSTVTFTLQPSAMTVNISSGSNSVQINLGNIQSEYGTNETGAVLLYSPNQQVMNQLQQALSTLSQKLIGQNPNLYFSASEVFQDSNNGQYYIQLSIYGPQPGSSGSYGLSVQVNGMTASASVQINNGNGSLQLSVTGLDTGGQAVTITAYAAGY
ncbi:MAG: hypothetical protein [aquatic viral metagenome]